MHFATAVRRDVGLTDRSGVLAVAAGRLRLLLTAGVLALVAAVVTVDVLAGGALRAVDRDVDAWNLDRRWPELLPLAKALVVLGQRGPVAVVVVLVVAHVAWRTRSWRPFVLPAAALALLNGVVGTLKIAIGRTAPYDGRDELFAGGTLYPSGHSANSVLMWGAVAVVLVTSGSVRRRWPLVTGIAVVSVIVGVASVFRDTHWATDVLAGWLLGGALLALLTAAAPLWAAPRAAHRRPASLQTEQPPRVAAVAAGSRTAMPARTAVPAAGAGDASVLAEEDLRVPVGGRA